MLKLAEPGGIQLWVVRRLAEAISVPLVIIFENLWRTNEA